MASELREKVDTDMTRRIPTIDVIEGKRAESGCSLFIVVEFQHNGRYELSVRKSNDIK